MFTFTKLYFIPGLFCNYYEIVLISQRLSEVESLTVLQNFTFESTVNTQWDSNVTWSFRWVTDNVSNYKSCTNRAMLLVSHLRPLCHEISKTILLKPHSCLCQSVIHCGNNALISVYTHTYFNAKTVMEMTRE